MSAIATSVDMGLYAATIDPRAMHEPTVLAFYFPYMMIVQVLPHSAPPSRPHACSCPDLRDLVAYRVALEETHETTCQSIKIARCRIVLVSF